MAALAVEPLLSTIAVKLETIRSFEDTYGAELAFHFDPITEFWGFTENPSSHILAFFLDPRQSHGQGQVYLRAFEKLVCSPTAPPLMSPAQLPDHVQSELAVKEGRIDVVVEYPGFCIAIENKLWAGDGDGQVDRYTTYLQRKYPSSHVLVYLTPDGREPDGSSKKTGDEALSRRPEEFKCLSWKLNLLPLIDEWQRLSRSDHVRWFLKSFERALRNKLGVREMNEQNQIVEHIRRTPGGISSTFAIASSIEALKAQLYDKLVSDAKDFADEKGERWQIDTGGRDWARSNRFGIRFSKSAWQDEAIWIGFEEGRSRVYIGVCHREIGKGVDDSSLLNRVKTNPQLVPTQLNPSSFPPAVWLTGQYFPGVYMNWEQPHVWADIQKGDGSEFYVTLRRILGEYSHLLDAAVE